MGYSPADEEKSFKQEVEAVKEWWKVRLLLPRIQLGPMLTLFTLHLVHGSHPASLTLSDHTRQSRWCPSEVLFL
jgi:hypothetical protein